MTLMDQQRMAEADRVRSGKAKGCDNMCIKRTGYPSTWHMD
jgi:hypothetical protein